MFSSARSYTFLSIGAAAATIVLKLAAWRITGSVGLFSDALESGVNLVAALAAFFALSLAAKPADREHPYGHFKAEYFSSGLESALILVAAAAILVTAVERLLTPEPLQQLGVGVGLSVVASAINGLVAWLLLRGSRRFHSITLRADAQHLLTDVWTSLGVVVAVALVQLTGLTILDPLIAIAVALNIVVMGWTLLRETASGLLDQALPDAEHQRLEAVLAAHTGGRLAVHALRTRVAGSRRFVAFHLLVPGHWSVQAGHDLCELLEREITAALPRTDVIIHLEPIDDPRSWQDDGFGWDQS